MAPTAASSIGFVLSAGVNYLLNRRFTMRLLTGASLATASGRSEQLWLIHHAQVEAVHEMGHEIATAQLKMPPQGSLRSGTVR